MGCKLTANITKDNCQYELAGVKAVYLFNYNVENAYTVGANKEIETITLPEGEKAYKMEFIDNSASWSDDVAVNGNGGKYRTHTVNFSLSQYDYNIINQGDALSLGKFVAVVVDKNKRAIILGRNNGLSATSFNYASGAADADANGWTVVLAGSELELGQILKDETVITSIVDTTVVVP